MKSIFLSLCFFISTTCVSQTDIAQIIKLMQQQEAAWSRGDIAAFMEHYWKNDRLMFIGSKGVTYGWQKTLDNYLKSYPNKAAMGILKFTIIRSEQLSEESIYIVGKWQLEKEKPAGGHFTLLWKKINNKWVIVADHTS